jgi:hypothetical protein
MTQPPRPAPLATAARVTGAAKDLAGGLADDFRRSDRPFKLRTGIVGIWIVLALVSLWIACPPSGPQNGLGAVARLEAGGIMGTQVLVQNEGSRHWTDVAFTLDGAWRSEQRTVRAGDKLVLSLASFAKDGQPPPPGLVPRQLHIECAEGRATLPLGATR